MSKVRRSQYAFLYLDDPVDIAALLRGEVAARPAGPRILALALLTGERHELSREQLEVLLSVPAERWIEDDGRHGDALRDLADRGLVLSDDEDPRLSALRERDEALAANQWNLYAALYHYMTQWSAVDIRDGVERDLQLGPESKAAARAFVAEHGLPPGPFAEPRSGRSVPLPDGMRDGVLYRTLLARRTTRAFDPEAPMTADELGTVLRHVFGCHGYAKNVADVLCIKRTSPSGGGLHPIEAYPIVSNVSGVEPGIYHYDARGHSLELISELDSAESRRTATSFMCGQSYFGAAGVSFVLTARFYRNHWKYRRHQKAYAGILMDAAHLSQTLYLVSTDLDLGAFVTVAINARDIEERLGLDGASEGVVAMTGCGRRAPGDSPLELTFWPRLPVG
jgi:putative peptide maturation dehydrogenase